MQECLLVFVLNLIRSVDSLWGLDFLFGTHVTIFWAVTLIWVDRLVCQLL